MSDVEIVYLCDPKKNKNCSKITCYAEPHNRNLKYGVCKWSTHPEHSKDGKTYRYDENTGEVVPIQEDK